MQPERLEAAQIKIERCIVLVVRSARLLEFAVGLRPALFAVEHDAVPKRITSRYQLARSIGGKGEGLVNFMSLLRINAAEKIDRARHDGVIGQLKGARPAEDTRAVKTIGDAKTSGELKPVGPPQKSLPFLLWGGGPSSRS